MKILITFADLSVKDGATLRVNTLVKKWDIDCIIGISSNSDFELNHILIRGELQEDKKAISKLSIIKRLSIQKSFNSARLPNFNTQQKTILYSADSIFAHTTRILPKLERQFLDKLEAIDLCDDLVLTYKNAAFGNFKKFNLKLSFIFLWEAFVEHYLIKKYSRKRLSFISQPTRRLAYKYEIFPNEFRINKDYSLQTIGPIIKKFGVIANFRTLANRSIVKNAIDLLGINESQIWLFGENSDNMLKDFPDVNIYGRYETVDELSDYFSVGLCLVDIQGGIQNKVLDYLTINKFAVISESVQRAFLEDQHYKEIISSPFVLLETEFSWDEVYARYNSENIRKNQSILFRIQA